MNKIPERVAHWVENFNLLSLEWRAVIAVIAMLLLTGLVAFVVSRVIGGIERRARKSSNVWDDVIIGAIRKPAGGFVWLQGIYWSAALARSYFDTEAFSFNTTMLKVGFILLLAWSIWRFVKRAEQVLVSPTMVKKPMDYTTALALSKLVRAIVLIIVALIVMEALGFSLSGLLAFGGVGGIAIGFAAKDLLANFFGGFMVFVDSPFKVGDWIRSPDQEIEGTVEHTGWRLTTIRTFDKRPLYVPNSVFSNISVENPSRMTNRRIFEHIGVRRTDMESLAAIVEDIRTMLENHEEIDQNQTLIVNFLQFNTSSLDIMIYTFTKTVQWVKYHAIKQDILLQISEIIASYGAEVAFPTQTLHLVSGAGQRAEPDATPDQNKAPEPDDRPDYREASDDLEDYEASSPANRTTKGDAD